MRYALANFDFDGMLVDSRARHSCGMEITRLS